MDAGPTLLVADPNARTVETETGTWVVSGCFVDELEALVTDADAVVDVRRRVGEVSQDALLFNVADDDTVHAFRSVVGSRPVYYLRSSDGVPILADHFRNALSQLDVDDRDVDENAIADHLLYRAPIPPSSPVAGIRLLGQGEWLTWDLQSNERECTLVDRLEVDERRSPGEAIDAVDETLSALLDGDGDPVALFSGGVDSTLTQTYLDGSVPMVNVGVDSPEYAFELEYAREGSELLESTLDQEVIPEEAVVDQIEAAIDATALPYHPLQSVMMAPAFSRYRGRCYVMAIGADSLFGNTNVQGALRAARLSPLLTSDVTEPLLSAVPGKPGSYLRWLRTLAEQQERPPEHPESFPHDWTYTNPELVSGMVTPEVVRSRARKQVQYVRDRVPLTTSNGATSQVELGQIVEQLGNRSGALWRHFAYAHGNGLVTPFEARGLFECSLSVPADDRYISGGLGDGTSKYILKELLERRLPEYPTDQEKGAGILPFERYRRNGVLGDVFERYDVPSFVPDEMRETVLEDSGRQAWNVITYAMWHDRVLSQEVQPVPPTTRLTW